MISLSSAASSILRETRWRLSCCVTIRFGLRADTRRARSRLTALRIFWPCLGWFRRAPSCGTAPRAPQTTSGGSLLYSRCGFAGSVPGLRGSHSSWSNTWTRAGPGAATLAGRPRVVERAMWLLPWFPSWQGQQRHGVKGQGTNLFTCCPPGPLDREKEVLPSGKLLSWNERRHVLASASCSGSKDASNA